MRTSQTLVIIFYNNLEGLNTKKSENEFDMNRSVNFGEKSTNQSKFYPDYFNIEKEFKEKCSQNDLNLMVKKEEEIDDLDMEKNHGTNEFTYGR